MRNLLKNAKLTMVLAGAATGTSAQNTAAVDMAGYEGVVFFGSFATANAGNYANLAQSTASGGTYNDLEGTKVTPGDNGDSWAIDVYRPTKRFVRAETVRAGATTVTGDVYALQYGARKPPVTHGATIDSETHVSPDEGTA